MELKFKVVSCSLTLYPIALIVPYGIEINHNYERYSFLGRALIVPYGIEIVTGLITKHRIKLALIVPYGIEICYG